MNDIKYLKRIGIFSAIENPLLPLFIKEISEIKGCKFYVISDLKKRSLTDSINWKIRTGGKLDSAEGWIANSARLKIPFYFVSNHNDEDCIDLVNDLNLDFIINAGTPRKLESKILSSSKLGVLNIHPGILPDFRGASCVEWAILQNLQIGNSAHWMNEEYDSGEVIEIEKYIFDKGSSYEDIRLHVYRSGIILMGKVVKKIISNQPLGENCDLKEVINAKVYKPISEENFRNMKMMIQDYKWVK